MNIKEMIPAFEAVLFASGEPMSIERFAQVFEIAPEEVIGIMDELDKKLKKKENGFELVRLENMYQLATKTSMLIISKKPLTSEEELRFHLQRWRFWRLWLTISP